MDTYLSNNQNRADSFGLPPVLIAADTQTAAAKARATIAEAGLRFTDVVSAEVVERLEQQVTACALWIELAGEPGVAIDTLLGGVAERVKEERCGAVVSIPRELIDGVGKYLFEGGFQVIIDADDAERAAALAVAVAEAGRPGRLSDISTDKNAARLRQLSDEVSRIASTLARLSTGPTPSPRLEPEARGAAPDISIETVRAVIRARRLRSRYFPEELFADPAWDMLLDLLQAELSRLRVPVSSLCIAAAVPATTALRWLKTMVQEGLFIRHADPHDGRRVFVELAPETSQALRSYFADVGPIAVI
jgi:hypothetical protein